MGTKVGLWIDHKKAIVITITEKGEEIRQIISEVEKQLRRSGDSPLEGPAKINSERFCAISAIRQIVKNC